MLQLEGTVYCISESNGNAPADDFCREVQEQVREAKKDAETRRNFMEFEYKQMLIAKDAREEERLAIYASLVQKGKLSLSDAISLSGLSEEEITDWIQAHPNT